MNSKVITCDDIELSEYKEFGWQLMYNKYKNDITEDQHLVIAVIHWLLIRNKFLCAGIGDKKELAEADLENSELLPDGWNSSENNIILRYVYMDTIYKIIFIKEDLLLRVSLEAIKGETITDVSNILVNFADTLKPRTCKTRYPLNQLLQNPQGFLYSIRDKLIRPVFDDNKQDGGIQTDPIEYCNILKAYEYESRPNLCINFIEKDKNFAFKRHTESIPLKLYHPDGGIFDPPISMPSNSIQCTRNPHMY